MATRTATNSVPTCLGRTRRARRLVVTNACSREADVKRAIRDRLLTLDFSLRCTSLRALKECAPAEPCIAQPECERLMRSLIAIADDIDALRKEIDI